jgi:hypothetical protein
MRTIEDGIHTDVTIEEYHENRTHVSATTLKYARQSLRHFKWFRDGKITVENKPHLSFGNAFELALLAPEEYLQKVAVVPDGDFIETVKAAQPEITSPRSTKRYKTLHEEFVTANTGKYLIRESGPESFECIEEMLSSCYQDKIIQGLIKNTEYQLSLFWTDPETGIKLKTRPDFCKRKKNVIVNVKTTTDGSPAEFSKQLAKWSYPLQATIEIRGAIATGLMDQVDNYFWLVVEKEPPFNACIYEFGTDDRNANDLELSYILGRLQTAEKQNMWPGYTEHSLNEYGILTAAIPAWYKNI